MVLPLDNIMELQRKCKSHNEAKKSCKVMTLNKKLRDIMSATVAGPIFL
jgi:hypothetical protein